MPRRHPPHLLRLAGLAVLVLAPLGARAEDPDAAVTPYRPTVSNPAELPVPGWLEAEFGGLRVFGADHSRADSVPWLLKYAFDADHGLLLGGDAYVAQDAPGSASLHGVGDTSLAWKQRFDAGPAGAFGLEAGVTLPSARRGLGVGKPQWQANGIYSRDLGAAHVDVNLGLAHAARHAAGSSAWQQAYAAALSWPLGSQWGGALEVSGAHQRGLPAQAQALAALNYNVSPRVVLDAGAARGLCHQAHDRSVFAGATVLLGRLR